MPHELQPTPASGPLLTLNDGCRLAQFHARRFHDLFKPLIYRDPAVSKVYTVKDRTKSWKDIRDKVLRKRAEDEKKETNRRAREYGIRDVKDASGFRVVCLFNADIPGVLQGLLAMIAQVEEKSDLPINLDSVEEIEIHTNRRDDDPLSIADKVKEVVNSQGLRSKLEKFGAKVEFSSYSSVHIVLRVQLPDDADEPQTVFTEIQVRSLFEEAWSEISHRLRYGPDKSATASGPPEVGSPPAGRWRRHLDALKSLADGCAQYSDLIAEEAVQEIAGRTQSLRNTPQSFEGGKNLYRNFPRDLLPDLNMALTQRDRAEQLARGEGAKAAEAEFMAAARTFEQLLTDLLGRQGDASRATTEPGIAGRGVDPATSEQIDRIKAELAFCLLYCGDDSLLPRADRLLQEVVAARPDWVPPLLRLGQLRLRLNELDEAQAKLEFALDKVAEPKNAEQTAMLVLIRTHLGIVYWRLSERPALPKAENIRLLCMSALQAEAVFGMNTEERHRRAAAANSAYCRAELLKRDPDRREVHEQIGKMMLEFLRAAPDYGAWSDEKRWSTMKLDSVLRAEKFFGDHAAAVSVANELVARINAKIGHLEALGLARSAAFDQLTFDERDIYLTALGVRDQTSPPGRRDDSVHAKP